MADTDALALAEQNRTEDLAVDGENSADSAHPGGDASLGGKDSAGRLRRLGRWCRSRLTVGTAITAIALAALIAWGTVMTVEYAGERHDDGLRSEAVATARQYAIAMSTFDFQNLDANKSTITSMSTPAFADKYQKMVDALRGVVTDGKGKATATADHVAVEQLADDHASVLVFADQHATNVTAPQGRDEKYRMVIDLVRSGDHWLVNNVQTI